MLSGELKIDIFGLMMPITVNAPFSSGNLVYIG